MATVFKIGDALADKYRGAGHALAAVTGGQVVGLVYVRDVLPNYDEEDGLAALAQAINEDRIGPTVRELQALGELYAGMCSCWEFVVL